MSQRATDLAREAGDPVHRVYAGYVCPRGGDDGHIELVNDPDFDLGCSGRGWDLFIEVDAGDIDVLPAWAQRGLLESIASGRELADPS